MRTLRSMLALPLLILALAGTAAASIPQGIANGDFCNGGIGWNVNALPGWNVTFPAAGGNPDCYGRIQSPFSGSGGTSSIFQTFNCGEVGLPANCIITFDYKLESLDSAPGTAVVVVLVDGVAQFTSPAAPTDWTNVTITVPCGNHVLSFDLSVAPQNNGWAACFDNAIAHCEPIVPTASSTWGRIKSLIISE